MSTKCLSAVLAFAATALGASVAQAAITPATYMVTNTSPDAFAAFPSDNRALFMPGLATDLAFTAPAHFSEFADGTAVLKGTVASSSNPAISFLVSIDYSGRVDVDPQTPPPPGSPKLDLLPSAYAANGGPVDPNGWHYYQNFSGTLLGLGALDGAKLSLVRMGPSWQVGPGASGFNIGLGMSGWMTVTTLQQPNSGPNLPAVFAADGNMNLIDDSDLCVDTAVTDPVYSVGFGGHAIWMPGAGGQFVFEPSGAFLMAADGTAKLTGSIKSTANANCRFLVDVDFTGKVEPGDVNYPPAGSPHRELDDDAYVYKGGPVDPATWIYYTQATGVLTGLGDCAGAVLNATNIGPAFQVGIGANGKNIAYGGSGWFQFTLVNPPTNPNTMILANSTGDMNFDLADICIDNPPSVPTLSVATYGSGCPGAGGFVPTLALTGTFNAGSTAHLTIDQGTSGAVAFVFLGLQQAALPLGNGCTLNVSPILPVVFGPVVLTGGGPGLGQYDFAFPMPLTLPPATLTMQAFVDEGGGLFANSNGVLVTIQ